MKEWLRKMNDVIIKKMDEEDIDGVVAIEKESFVTPWSKEALSMELKNNMAMYIVARYDGKVVGYGGFWTIIDEAHITNIAVKKDFRGNGIGETILSSLIQICRVKGIKSMTLEVRKSNESAKNLYKKLNFKEVGIRPKYYSDNNEDAIIMWLTIQE